MSDVAHRQQIQTKRELVRALRGSGAAGLATAALAAQVGVDTKRTGELLRTLAAENVVERVGQAGLGDGQWRLVGDEQ